MSIETAPAGYPVNVLYCVECDAGFYRAEPVWDGKHHVHYCTNDACDNGVTVADFEFEPGERLVTDGAPGYGDVLAFVTDHWVIITRDALTESGDFTGETLAPLAIGPFSEADADEECQSDGGIVYSLLTEDCAREGWCADDVFTTTDVPADAERIIVETAEVAA